MKTKKRNVFLLSALALVLLAGVAGGGYAYWAGSVTAPTGVDKNDTVTIGEGQPVTSKLTVGDAAGTGILVPVGHDVEVDDVEYVVLTHSVKWEENGTALATGHAGTLSAALVADSVEIAGDDTYADLVNITIQVGGTAPVDDGVVATASSAIYLDGAAVVVYILVTLDEPADQTEYDAIAGEDITFEVEFSVSPS